MSAPSRASRDISTVVLAGGAADVSAAGIATPAAHHGRAGSRANEQDGKARFISDIHG